MALRSRTLSRATVVLVALGLLVGVAFSAALAKPLDPGKSDSHRVVETSVWIEAGDHRIPGVFTVPKAGGLHAEHPAVLLLHGFGADKNEGANMFGRLAEDLGVAGVASLRVDFAGTGDSEQPWIENNLDSMVADATTALDWLSAQDNVDADRIGLHGWSMGGRVSATIVGTDDRVKTLSTWAGAVEDGTATGSFYDEPAADVWGFIDECEGGDPTVDSMYDCAVLNGSVLYAPYGRVFELSQAWFDTMAASQALTLLANYEGRQLAVHGDLDVVVPPSVSRNAIAGSGSYDATLRIIRDGDHTFGVYVDPLNAISEDVLEITTNWIDDKL